MTTQDRRFEPSRSARSSGAKAIVAAVLERLEHYEAHSGQRQRKRRPRDKQTHAVTVSAVVLDAAHRHLTCPQGRVSLSLSNDVLRRSYPGKHAALNAMLPSILESLSTLQLVSVTKGRRVAGAARLSTFAAGPALVALIAQHGVAAQDHLADDPEVIELRARKSSSDSKPKLIAYRETAQVAARRSQIKTINEWLAGADIACSGLDNNGEPVDASDRTLRRIFNNGTFKHGGRLYGGFWQRLSATQRRASVLIEGEAVAELDYAQCGPRLLYAKAGKVPPADCYAVPGFERFRDGFKLLWSALVAKGVKGVKRYPDDAAAHFRNEVAFAKARALLLELHATIAPLVQPDEGFSIQFRESEMLVGLLLRMKQAGIVALPIHDSVLVKRSAASEAKRLMEEAFTKEAGIGGIVRVSW